MPITLPCTGEFRMWRFMRQSSARAAASDRHFGDKATQAAPPQRQWRPRRPPAPPLVSPTRLLTVVALLCAALGHAVAADSGELARLLDRAQAAVRVDPERTRQLAEQALQTLGPGPDADAALADQRLRAHLLLCDHHTERDRATAEQHAAQARLVLPTAARQGLRAMLLTCEGDMHELAGDSAQAAALYEQAVNAAEQARDDEMLGD